MGDWCVFNTTPTKRKRGRVFANPNGHGEKHDVIRKKTKSKRLYKGRKPFQAPTPNPGPAAQRSEHNTGWRIGEFCLLTQGHLMGVPICSPAYNVAPRHPPAPFPRSLEVPPGQFSHQMACDPCVEVLLAPAFVQHIQAEDAPQIIPERTYGHTPIGKCTKPR